MKKQPKYLDTADLVRDVVNRRGCSKTRFQEICQKRNASGCPTNDFLGSHRHFLSPEFALIFGNPSFSTATGDYTQNRVPASNFLDAVRLLIRSWVGRVPAVAESRDLFKDVGHYLPPDLVILTPLETRSADNFV